MIYLKEFRREVLAACDAKLGTRKVALQFNVSESWVRRIKQERREQGKLGPATKRRRTPKWVAEADAIQAAIAKHPDLSESVSIVGGKFGFLVSCGLGLPIFHSREE
jgi:transposase